MLVVLEKMMKIVKRPRLFQFAVNSNQSKRTFRSFRKLSSSQSIRENLFGHFSCASGEGPPKTSLAENDQDFEMTKIISVCCRSQSVQENLSVNSEAFKIPINQREHFRSFWLCV